MVSVRKVARALMDSQSLPKRELSPQARERERQHAQFKRLVSLLTGPDKVFELRLGPTEKPITIRQRLLRVAAESGVEIAVRKHGEGLLVGLLTPERRTNRGFDLDGESSSGHDGRLQTSVPVETSPNRA